jgi:hypothetical protein
VEDDDYVEDGDAKAAMQRENYNKNEFVDLILLLVFLFK